MSGYISSVTLACYNIVSKSGLQTFPSKTNQSKRQIKTNKQTQNHFFSLKKVNTMIEIKYTVISN